METGETKDIKNAPANKMQTADSTKKEEGVEQTYFFPAHNASATGKTAEEALAKITKASNN